MSIVLPSLSVVGLFLLSFSALTAKALLATILANLVLANIDSPKPSGPTTDPSALVASGLKLKRRNKASSIILSPCSLLVCFDLI